MIVIVINLHTSLINRPSKLWKPWTTNNRDKKVTYQLLPQGTQWWQVLPPCKTNLPTQLKNNSCYHHLCNHGFFLFTNFLRGRRRRRGQTNTVLDLDGPLTNGNVTHCFGFGSQRAEINRQLHRRTSFNSAIALTHTRITEWLGAIPAVCSLYPEQHNTEETKSKFVGAIKLNFERISRIIFHGDLQIHTIKN